MRIKERLELHEWLLRGCDGREVKLAPAANRSLTVGRELTSDVPLLDAGVSRHHALILLEGGQLFVEDLHSQNGTFVNSERVQRAPLREGDIITFGRVHLTLLSRERQETSLAALVRPLSHGDLSRLLEIARELSAMQDSRSAFQRTLDAAAEALHADRGMFLLWEAERRLFHPVAAHPHEECGEMGQVVNRSLAEAVLKSGKAQAFGQSQGGEAPGAPLESKHETRSRTSQSSDPEERLRLTSAAQNRFAQPMERPSHPVVACPLASRAEPIGIVYLERHLSRKAFERAEVDFLSAFVWVSEPMFDASLHLANRTAPSAFLVDGWGEKIDELRRQQIHLENPPGPRSGRASGEETHLPVRAAQLLALLDDRVVEAERRLQAKRWQEKDPYGQHAENLHGEALAEFFRLSRYTKALRFLFTIERPAARVIDVYQVVQQVLETCDFPRERWSMESGRSVLLLAAARPLILTLELLVDAAAAWLGPEGKLAVECRTTATRVQLRLAVSCRDSTGSEQDVELPLALARSLLQDWLHGRLGIELGPSPHGSIDIELPQGLSSLEETLVL